MQHIHVLVDTERDVSREWLNQVSPDVAGGAQTYPNLDLHEDDEREEIKRILEYRQIATDGDSATALTLLEKLKNDERFSTGHVAFRLNFNIGIVQHNIGELDEANVSLRAAYDFHPENKKAQAGLALAELNEGNEEQAFERAQGLLGHDGDHQSLSALVALRAAAGLKRDFKIDDYQLQEPHDPDLVAARLEYLSALESDEYLGALEAAFTASPSNGAVASMWAQAVLDDVRQNQAFLLGARMPELFDEKVARSAKILRAELEASLKCRPPNRLLLPSQANNAAIALQLAGNVAEAARLLDRVLTEHPALQGDLAQIRGVLFLQEDKDSEALEQIAPLRSKPDLQIMASEIEAKMGKPKEALSRINETLKTAMPEALRSTALFVKARIAVRSFCQ